MADFDPNLIATRNEFERALLERRQRGDSLNEIIRGCADAVTVASIRVGVVENLFRQHLEKHPDQTLSELLDELAAKYPVPGENE